MAVLDENVTTTEPKVEEIHFPGWVPENRRVPENKVLASLKDELSLMDAYVNLTNKMSSSRRVPDFEQADPEEVDKFWKYLGAPDAVDGYKEHLGLDETAQAVLGDSLDGILESALEAKIPAKQLATTLKKFTEKRTAEAQKRAEELTGLAAKHEEILKERAGTEFETVVGEVQNFAKSSPLYDEHLHNVLVQNGLASHPLIIMGMHALSKTSNGSKWPKFEPKGTTGPSLEDINSQIKALQSDPAFMNDAHPNHRATVQRNLELHRIRGELLDG